MKIHHVYSNYLENPKVKQVYDTFSSVDRPLYPRIMTSQLKNLLSFHKRANELEKILNKFSQTYRLDMSLLKKEVKFLLEILSELINNIDPDILKTKEYSDGTLDDLLLIFILFKKLNSEGKK